MESPAHLWPIDCYLDDSILDKDKDGCLIVLLNRLESSVPYFRVTESDLAAAPRSEVSEFVRRRHLPMTTILNQGALGLVRIPSQSPAAYTVPLLHYIVSSRNTMYLTPCLSYH